ncbi:hypothetical protein [Thalassotalea agarivorans]|uniref:Inhibitor of sigma-G Gin n=1 Tax=Thalassotalea agarivorans TaxID=349064 RepID=A0A1I0H443_THASX|nr:hypothetical protein [Thalassotalea agarivorans]SET78396.1 Inhibitor of sigma-G Gin [Thalassotalea agarivorans]
MNKLIDFYNEHIVGGMLLVETIDGNEVEVKRTFHDSLITKFENTFCDCGNCGKSKEKLDVILYHSFYDFICLDCFKKITEEDMKNDEYRY